MRVCGSRLFFFLLICVWHLEKSGIEARWSELTAQSVLCEENILVRRPEHQRFKPTRKYGRGASEATGLGNAGARHCRKRQEVARVATDLRE